jgi:hypothetical protein
MTQLEARGENAPAPGGPRVTQPVERALEKVQAGYKGQDMPLGAYTVLMGLYGLSVGGLLWAASRKKDRPMAENVKLADVIVLGVATHKVSRLITKDWVTSPLRAPFTEYKSTTGAGEVEETARGQGMQLAMGQLLTCPWCTGAWVAALMTTGFALKPRLMRLVSAIFAVETISDNLHLAYAAIKEREK